MHAQQTAKEFLRNRFDTRLAAIRGEAPGGNWIDIRCFHLPLNETLPDVCRLQSTSSPSGSAAEVLVSASAATNSTE